MCSAADDPTTYDAPLRSPARDAAVLDDLAALGIFVGGPDSGPIDRSRPIERTGAIGATTREWAYGIPPMLPSARQVMRDRAAECRRGAAVIRQHIIANRAGW